MKMTRNSFRVLQILALVVACLLMARNVAWSQPLTVSDGNASITVDPDTVTDPSGNFPGGMLNWSTDGINDVYEQSWYHRIGNATQESHLAVLPLILEEIVGTNQIHLTYSGSGLEVDALYTLTGGPAGSGTSMIEESVTLTNLDTANPLPVTWFEYDDFDIPELTTNIASGGVNGITQQNLSGERIITVTPLSPTPDAFQISEAGNVQALRTSLTDSAITNLSNGTSPFGPLDIDFAFQWNLTIPANDSLTISKTKVAVPEPGAITLISVGMLGLLAVGCRRNK